MVVVEVKMWPKGDSSKEYSLGRATISLVGSNESGTRGDYEYVLYDKAGKYYNGGSIEGFPRKLRLVWDLLYRVLRAEFSRRN